MAADKVSTFLNGKQWEDYVEDDLLRAGVERQFEIIGEALNQLSKIDPETVAQISDYKQIISFRNLLIHGYADIDDRLVWSIVQTKLPGLRLEVSNQLA
ncbi:HepT-like ribonuclease domain-containing protein [Leucothrix mucor]|uniref:HepT-like ribonuclease domain-containing protein n=1 Tax=Leucothrix mucor TaxID=45248 RepID=UPI003CCBE03B